MIEIFRQFQFEAAHRLPALPPGHKCSRLHGHSYRVDVFVGGDLRAEEGWIMDFEEVKAAFSPVVEQLDHHYLNEIAGLENPTCELLAIWIWDHLQPLPLTKVIVHETCTAGAVYTGEGRA